MRLAVDTGGTFTDLLVERDGATVLAKAPTTPDDPARCVLDAIAAGASAMGLTARQLLASSTMLIHGTTRGLNAVLTGTAARTALLVTQGHPDLLMMREGGRVNPFVFTQPYPEPYVPRSLTFEVPERIGYDGNIISPLDEEACLELIERLRAERVEAVAVCLLWSVVNPAHEERLGALIEERLPHVAVSLSHRVNPALREYRRACSTAIDASLKPIMTRYLERLEGLLRDGGFGGRLLVTTSDGGMVDAQLAAASPILALNSGPAMAPVAGRWYAKRTTGAVTAIVADAGGTTFDVSVVRRGVIPRTREAWVGQPILGNMIGFPAIDVRSIGAGGGSVASVDAEGLLHVGPQSVGSVPGPACYGRGGFLPAVTDAAVVLGFIDPSYFLGGSFPLDAAASWTALREHVADPLGMDVENAAAAVMTLATEHMTRAIGDMTIKQGIDPRESVLVAGGGASGLNALAIAKRLDMRCVLVPDTAAALSAAGAFLSDLVWTASRTAIVSSGDFLVEIVNAALLELGEECRAFAESAGISAEPRMSYSVEARYQNQAWEIEVPVQTDRFGSASDSTGLAEVFHAQHRDLFGFDDRQSAIEYVTWRCRIAIPVASEMAPVAVWPCAGHATSRSVMFPEHGRRDARVVFPADLRPNELLPGPAIVEVPASTIVIEPGFSVMRTDDGTLVLGRADRVVNAVSERAEEGQA